MTDSQPTRTGLYWWLYAHWNCRRLPTFLGGSRRFLKWRYDPERKVWTMLWKQHPAPPTGYVHIPYDPRMFPKIPKEILDDLMKRKR